MVSVSRSPHGSPETGPADRTARAEVRFMPRDLGRFPMLFPRPDGRGPIEAGVLLGEPGERVGFRDRTVAAPLKRPRIRVWPLPGSPVSATGRSRPH